MKKIIICLFLSIGLGSCHIYKAYEHPDMTVVDSLYRRPVVTEDTVSLASLSCLQIFDCRSLLKWEFVTIRI